MGTHEGKLQPLVIKSLLRQQNLEGTSSSLATDYMTGKAVDH